MLGAVMGCAKPAEEVATIDVAPPSETHQTESAGLCPWREPDADLRAFFPGATGTRDETLVLSRQSLEIGKRLGHPATGEDRALQIHRVLEGDRERGVVVARRIRGDAGAMELVLAIDETGKVIGARLQRQREPDAVARALRSPAVLAALKGKTADSDFTPGADVPTAARADAQALFDGARAALILLDLSKSTSHRA